ncbi:hypothetical protein HDU90_001615 [Geranomyces variabilis]|nr:hypothetical protein HDU90_001615 [Geranomyces variabilis]
MTVYPNHYSDIFAANQPKCVKWFEITVTSSLCLPIAAKKVAAAITPSEKPPAYEPTVEATLTVQVTKPTVASAVQWVFEGLEYNHAPTDDGLLKQRFQTPRQLIRKSGLILSQPTTFLPGETYTYLSASPSQSTPFLRTALSAQVSDRSEEKTPWYKFRNKKRKLTRCESIVYIGTDASKLPAPAPPSSRQFAHVGDSTVAIVCPLYIALTEQRQPQTIQIETNVIAGSAKLVSASIEFCEYMPSGSSRVRDSVTGGAGALPTAVLASDFEHAGPYDTRRVLMQPKATELSLSASGGGGGVSTATIPVEIPGAAYTAWRDDVDTLGVGGYISCTHWLTIVLKGIEEGGKKVKCKAAVPIAVHGAFSCTVEDMHSYWEVYRFWAE